jgi:hypothetical protein
MQITEETKVLLKATNTELTKMFYEMIAKQHGISIIEAKYNDADGVITMIGRKGDPHVLTPLPLSVGELIGGPVKKNKNPSQQSLRGMTDYIKGLVDPGYRMPLDKLTVEVRKIYRQVGEKTIRMYLNNMSCFKEVDPNVFERVAP